MEQEQNVNQQGEQKAREGAAANSSLQQEINRAMELMGRVKTSNEVHAANIPEDRRMPSYFFPPPVILCSCVE